MKYWEKMQDPKKTSEHSLLHRRNEKIGKKKREKGQNSLFQSSRNQPKACSNQRNIFSGKIAVFFLLRTACFVAFQLCVILSPALPASASENQQVSHHRELKGARSFSNSHSQRTALIYLTCLVIPYIDLTWSSPRVKTISLRGLLGRAFVMKN